MEIVPAMVLYEGSNMLKEVARVWRIDQQKEIRSALPTLTRDQEVNHYTDDFAAGMSLGIELGLSSARAVLAASSEVITHGADPAKIL
jgi:hypothetical protein